MSALTLVLFSKNDIKYHTLVWCLITVFVCLIDPIEGKFSVQLIGTFLIILAYMFVYYSQYLVSFRYTQTKNIFKLTVIMLVIFITYLGIIFLNFYYVFDMFRFKDKVDYNVIFDWIMSCFILYSIISVIAYGFYQNKTSLYKLQIENENEKTILNKELGFYKNQFNPHITFNFLNYCYSFVNQKSPEAADVIEIYSEMLRYTINCNANETVPLKDEVEYLSKFIYLKKQLSNGIFVQFDIQGDLLQKQILPRILITFIENAFKHGDAHSEENPIHIRIETTITEIIFMVSNKKNTSKNKPISTGIGKINVVNQLEYFYKEKYELIINEDNSDFYRTTLKINIK